MYNNNVVRIDFTGVFISCTLRTLKVASVHKRGTHISVGPFHIPSKFRIFKGKTETVASNLRKETVRYPTTPMHLSVPNLFFSFAHFILPLFLPVQPYMDDKQSWNVDSAYLNLKFYNLGKFFPFDWPLQRISCKIPASWVGLLAYNRVLRLSGANRVEQRWKAPNIEHSQHIAT